MRSVIDVLTSPPPSPLQPHPWRTQQAPRATKRWHHEGREEEEEGAREAVDSAMRATLSEHDRRRHGLDEGAVPPL